jgi:hypothetical protein
MNNLKTIVIVFICLFILALLIGLFRHVLTQTSTQQQKFLSGKVTSSLPDGLYKGTVGGKETTWKGKKFDKDHNRGINIFQNGDTTREAFPFKTYVENGAADKSLLVIKIDYNLPENPLWLRLVVDEIVEVSPGKYLGKLHVRIFPDTTFALGFFELEK